MDEIFPVMMHGPSCHHAKVSDSMFFMVLPRAMSIGTFFSSMKLPAMDSPFGTHLSSSIFGLDSAMLPCKVLKILKGA